MATLPSITLVCIAEYRQFRLSSRSPPGQIRASPLSQLVQTEFPPSRPASTLFRTTPFWQIAVLAALSLWLYARTIIHLVGQWWHDPNFSHGFFVPVFAAFVIWQERERLARLKPQPSWSGLLLLAVALCVLIVGQMGAELFLARFSLLLLLAAIIVLFWGWRLFQAMLFPLAFLLLMTLAIIYGYLMEKRVALRWVLVLSAIPISVAANSVRIIGTGLLVQYWDPDKAQGFFHTFSGWLIFVVSLLMLYLLHLLLRVIWHDREANSK